MSKLPLMQVARSPIRSTVPVAERRIFAIAVGAGVLHGIDDAVLHRQPGVAVGQHAWALLASVVVAGLAVAGFGRLRVGVRAGLAMILGVLILANGAMHVAHVWMGSVAASDLSGLVATAGGVVLLGMAVVVPFRHRGEGAQGRRRRWVNRVIAVVSAVVAVAAFVVPVTVAMVQTHRFREAIGNPPGPAFRDVTFESSDGLHLSGWYATSKNGAAVVVVSSSRGDRMGSVQHADLLVRHGYGVLIYDARGTGRSEGSPNGWGWGWGEDVDGAVTFLQRQVDVDPTRVGAVGLSTGADAVIEAASRNHDLQAVVADGATARSLQDVMPVTGFTDVPFAWSMYTAAKVFSGSAPGRPLKGLVADVSPTPVLLIASGSIAQEIPLNEIYADSAREPVELWELPDVHHTAAIRERAATYEWRVVGFLDTALAQR